MPQNRARLTEKLAGKPLVGFDTSAWDVKAASSAKVGGKPPTGSGHAKTAPAIDAKIGSKIGTKPPAGV